MKAFEQIRRLASNRQAVVARQERRIDELLEANNRYLLRARTAESENIQLRRSVVALGEILAEIRSGWYLNEELEQRIQKALAEASR